MSPLKKLCHKNVQKKVTAKFLITDLMIIDKFLVLNFKQIAIHAGFKNKPDEV